jgi:hypothetical protein
MLNNTTILAKKFILREKKEIELHPNMDTKD